MLLTDLMTESLIGGERSRAFATPDALINFINNSGYDNHFTHFEQYPLYRGSRSTIGNNAGMLVSPGSDRTSANTTNEYNLFLSGDPTWRDFPKRSGSIICSTYEGIANNYTGNRGGDVFAVILPNTFLVGVAPRGDLWNSFPNLSAKLNDNYYDVVYFNKDLRGMIQAVDNIDSVSTYEQLLNSMNNITNTIRSNMEESSSTPISGTRLEHYITNILLEDDRATVHTIIQELLDPYKNGFDASSRLGSLDSIIPHEVWTDADCILIPYSLFRRLSQDVA